MINSNGGFIAEVRNINDPYQSGRYQLRIYGHHNDEQNIKDEHLPWAQFLHHAGSAATSKIGMMPTGPIVGSRVYGTFLDGDGAKQYPIILGTFPRGATLSDSSNADVGQDGLDSKSNGIDTPVVNGTANGNFGLTPNAPGLGGTAVNPTSAQFNNAPTVANDQGQNGANTARQMHAPNADQPTIAGTDPSTNLPSALQQTGSSAQVLPMMVDLLSQVQSMMNMNNSSSQNNSNNPSTTNLSGLPASLGQAFGAILVRISYHLGFDYVVGVLANTFSYNYNHYYDLDKKYQAPVIQGIMYLIQNYENYTTYQSFTPPANVFGNTVSNTNIVVANSVSTYTNTNINIITSSVNLPYPLLSSPPKYYIQKYFIYRQDPFPGYIEWLGPNGERVLTVRTQNNPNYSSSTDAITGSMKVQMFDILYPYFQQGFVRAAYINAALNVVYDNAQNDANDSLLGNNSSDSDSDILQSAIAILGPIGSLISSANTEHIPNSVFNQSSMSSTLQTYAQNMGSLQQMKNTSNSAFMPNSSIGSIFNSFSGISSMFSSSSSGGLSSDTSDYLQNQDISSTNISSLSNVISNTTSSNTIATIASVTKTLQTANASSNTISEVQLLLSEILVTNTNYSYVSYGQ